jgi:hypothetical protein
LRSSRSNAAGGGVDCGRLSHPSALNPRDSAAILCGATVCDRATQAFARDDTKTEIETQMAMRSGLSSHVTVFRQISNMAAL